MSGVVNLIVLILVFLLMGWMTAPRGDGQRRWRRTLIFLGAVGLGTALVLFGFVVLLLVMAVLGTISVLTGLDAGLFTGVFIVVLLAGVVLFACVLPLLRRMRISQQVLTIIEYYIQWMLIYVTIYQVAVDQLGGLRSLLGDAELEREVQGYLSTILDPAFLVVLLLPVLISVWVTVAMAKLRIEAEHDVDAADTVTFRRAARRRDRVRSDAPAADDAGSPPAAAE